MQASGTVHKVLHQIKYQDIVQFKLRPMEYHFDTVSVQLNSLQACNIDYMTGECPVSMTQVRLLGDGTMLLVVPPKPAPQRATQTRLECM